jgi:CRP-like cAMP-binding protein
VDGGFFDQLEPDDRRALLSKMTRRSFRKSDTLFHEGDPGDTFHVIIKGHVAIRISTRDGDVATLTMLGPDASFGELALLDAPGLRTASAVALDSVETRSLHRSEFEALRATSPSVERFLIHVLAAQVRRLSDHLLDALYVTAEQRVVRRLCDVGNLYANGEAEVLVPLTQDDLASMAGTTRPTTNRVLQQLRTLGIIRTARGQIVVVDRARLDKRAR